jgi:hypothetical protein
MNMVQDFGFGKREAPSASSVHRPLHEGSAKVACTAAGGGSPLPSRNMRANIMGKYFVFICHSMPSTMAKYRYTVEISE